MLKIKIDNGNSEDIPFHVEILVEIKKKNLRSLIRGELALPLFFLFSTAFQKAMANSQWDTLFKTLTHLSP